MPTFAELQQRLSNAKHRKTILLRLVEYIDENFLPVGDVEPKMRLLDDDKLPVPVEMFEAVASDTLSAEVQQLDQEIAGILASVVAQQAPPSPQVAPGQVDPSEQSTNPPQQPTVQASTPPAPHQRRRRAHATRTTQEPK